MLTVACSTSDKKIPVIREGVSERDRASPLTVSAAFLSAGRAKMSSQEDGHDSCNEANEEDLWVNISAYPSEGQIVSPVAIFNVYENFPLLRDKVWR